MQLVKTHSDIVTSIEEEIAIVTEAKEGIENHEFRIWAFTTITPRR